MNLLQASESERKSIAKSTRKRLAEIEVAEKRLHEIDAVLERLGADSDAAADEHRAATEPLQAELNALDEKQIEQIAAGKRTSKADDARRSELTQQIVDANSKLEEVVARNRRLAIPITKQRHEVQMTIVEKTALENRLCQCRPDAELDADWSRQQAMRWASARVSDARTKLTTAQELCELSKRRGESDNQRIYGIRARRWGVELSEAQAVMAEIRSEHDQIREKTLSP